MIAVHFLSDLTMIAFMFSPRLMKLCFLFYSCDLTDCLWLAHDSQRLSYSTLSTNHDQSIVVILFLNNICLSNDSS